MSSPQSKTRLPTRNLNPTRKGVLVIEIATHAKFKIHTMPKSKKSSQFNTAVVTIPG